MTTLSDEFSKYGAKLRNVQWAVSAISKHEELVMSLWQHYFKKHEGSPPSLRYTDTLSRWSGNKPGNNLCREHLLKAKSENLRIRLVIARTKETEAIDRGVDASKVKKTFGARMDLVGHLTSFEGDEFVIDFVRDESA